MEGLRIVPIGRMGKIYWISEDVPKPGVGKLDGIEEAFFVWVGEDELPCFAGVGGFVEAGEVSFA
jgi:hypothetical protein